MALGLVYLSGSERGDGDPDRHVDEQHQTQARLVPEKPRPARISGRAMFTMVKSMPIISWQASMTARVARGRRRRLSCRIPAAAAPGLTRVPRD
jgi:hypothetical protein